MVAAFLADVGDGSDQRDSAAQPLFTLVMMLSQQSHLHLLLKPSLQLALRQQGVSQQVCRQKDDSIDDTPSLGGGGEQRAAAAAAALTPATSSMVAALTSSSRAAFWRQQRSSNRLCRGSEAT